MSSRGAPPCPHTESLSADSSTSILDLYLAGTAIWCAWKPALAHLSQL